MKKQLIIKYSHILIPVISFVVALLFLSWSRLMGNWPVLVSATAAILAFGLMMGSLYLVVSNLEDRYRLEVLHLEEVVRGQIRTVRRAIDDLRVDQSTLDLLENICIHATELITRTPNSSQLTTLTVLTGWLEVIIPALDQYRDMLANPDYHFDASKRLAEAKRGFESFDKFLLQSIRTVEKGDTIDFEIAVQRLNAARPTLSGVNLQKSEAE